MAISFKMRATRQPLVRGRPVIETVAGEHAPSAAPKRYKLTPAAQEVFRRVASLPPQVAIKRFLDRRSTPQITKGQDAAAESARGSLGEVTEHATDSRVARIVAVPVAVATAEPERGRWIKIPMSVLISAHSHLSDTINWLKKILGRDKFLFGHDGVGNLVVGGFRELPTDAHGVVARLDGGNIAFWNSKLTQWDKLDIYTESDLMGWPPYFFQRVEAGAKISDEPAYYQLPGPRAIRDPEHPVLRAEQKKLLAFAQRDFSTRHAEQMPDPEFVNLDAIDLKAAQSLLLNMSVLVAHGRYAEAYALAAAPESAQILCVELFVKPVEINLEDLFNPRVSFGTVERLLKNRMTGRPSAQIMMLLDGKYPLDQFLSIPEIRDAIAPEKLAQYRQQLMQDWLDGEGGPKAENYHFNPRQEYRTSWGADTRNFMVIPGLVTTSHGISLDGLEADSPGSNVLADYYGVTPEMVAAINQKMATIRLEEIFHAVDYLTFRKTGASASPVMSLYAGSLGVAYDFFSMTELAAANWMGNDTRILQGTAWRRYGPGNADYPIRQLTDSDVMKQLTQILAAQLARQP